MTMINVVSKSQRMATYTGERTSNVTPEVDAGCVDSGCVDPGFVGVVDRGELTDADAITVKLNSP